MSRLAEREGFEPPVPFGITGFQDQRLQPLGHRSRFNQPDYIIMSLEKRQEKSIRPINRNWKQKRESRSPLFWFYYIAQITALPGSSWCPGSEAVDAPAFYAYW